MTDYCHCPTPSTSSDPRKPATHCGKCGHPKHPGWDQNDSNFAAFWDRIEETRAGWQYPLYEPPDEEQTLRLQTTHRELAGRKHFGYAYLQRDNIREAREEICDALLYLYLESLKDAREGTDPEWDVVLEIADDLINAYTKFAQLRQKHRGMP